jgi:hypothetical protein
MTRRVLVPNPEIERVLDLAEARNFDLSRCGLDVGPNYVRLIPPSQGSDSIADYIGPAHRPSKASSR